MNIPTAVYVLAPGAFALITTELGVIGLLPQISEAFGISISQAGWLLSAFALVIAFCGPWMTLLFSGVDRKVCLCLVLALFSVSNIASALSPSFIILLVTRVIPAFVHPVFWSVAMSVAATSVEAKLSSRAVSVVFTGFSAGIVLGIPIASLAAGFGGWQAGFLVFGALNLIALAVHVIVLPKMPVKERLSFSTQLGVLKKPRLWWNLTVQVLLTAAAFSIYSYMAEYLKTVSRMDAGSISLMLFIFGAAGVLGTLVAGWLMGLRLTATAFGFTILFASTMALLYLSGDSYPAAVLLVLVWGLVHAAAIPLCQALVLRAAPEAPEFSNSLFNSFGNLGLTAGTVAGGYFIATYGILELPLASIGIIACSGIALLVERRLNSIRERASLPRTATSTRRVAHTSE